jgi:hypothetical protein
MTDIPQKVFTTFKLRCVSANMTLREGVIWLFTQVGKGAIRLPEKEE